MPIGLEFKNVSGFPRGILFELLADAYSFDFRCIQGWGRDWREFDRFFFDNPQIADRCGFITALHDEAIGFVSWDPRNLPDYVQIGHNCIASKYKGRGYGKAQLREAVDRIRQSNARKIIVTTNELMVPAQRMYAGVGFQMIRRRPYEHFSGDFIDYELYNEVSQTD